MRRQALGTEPADLKLRPNCHVTQGMCYQNGKRWITSHEEITSYLTFGLRG
jgi:hypothetical protein